MNTSSPTIDELRRAVRLRPGDLDAHVALAIALATADAPDASEATQHAIDALVRAYKVGDPGLDATVCAAFDNLEAGIVRAWGHVRACGVAIPRGWMVLQRDGSDAVGPELHRLEALIEGAGDDPFAHRIGLFGADLAFAANRPDLALQWLEAVEGLPVDFAALAARSEILLGHHAAAIARCEAALASLAGANATDLECELLCALANASMAAGDTDRAEAALDRGITLAPGRPDLLAASSSLHAMKGQPAVALGIIDGLIERGVPGLEARRAQLLAKTGG
jgi:hypothetical protein